MELCLTLGSQMVLLAGGATTIDEARKLLQDAISSGKALETLKTFLSAQGGDPSVVDDVRKLPTATYKINVPAKKSGYISNIIADKIGVAAMVLGAGRATKDSVIDLAVGIELRKKVGDYVEQGEALVTLHSNQENVGDVLKRVYESYTITDATVPAQTLV
jgi:pyrimidine-nucleoside phosphorylase